MQANDVRTVRNLRGSLHYLLVKMEAERQALIRNLMIVRKQALALLARVRRLAVPVGGVDGIIPEKPCSHRYYRELRKAFARPAKKVAGLLLLPAPAVAVPESDPEVARATAALKLKRAALVTQQQVPVNA